MKKVYLMLTMLASLGFAASAQQGSKVQGDPHKFQVDPAQQDWGRFSPNKANEVVSDWYSPLNSTLAAAPDPNTFSSSAAIVFPDSLPAGIFSTGKTHWFRNGFGQVLDPKDPNFGLQDPAQSPFSKFNAYTWDSLAFTYLYVRQLDSVNGNAVVDTLFVQYFRMSGLQKGTLSGTPTETFARPVLNASSAPGPLFAANEFKRDTILLTRNDSTPLNLGGANGPTFGFKTMTLPVGISISQTSDNLCAYAVQFKPGYSYAMGDTLLNFTAGGTQPTKKMNFFGNREIQNDQANPQVFQTKYYGNALILDKRSRYPNPSPTAWQGFIPGNSFFDKTYTVSFFHITSQNVSAKDINANGYGLGDAYPNPAQSSMALNIPFAIGKAATVNFSVTNLLGQTVMSSSEQFSAGQHTYAASLSNLQPGVYFYTVSSGDFSSTKKVTVQ